jgi:hypothetical protein
VKITPIQHQSDIGMNKTRSMNKCALLALLVIAAAAVVIPEMVGFGLSARVEITDADFLQIYFSLPLAAVQFKNVTLSDVLEHSFLNKMCITDGLLCDKLNESENRTGLVCSRGPSFDLLYRSWC